MTDDRNLMAENVVPYGQVPSGSYFRLARVPDRKFQKVRHEICVNEAYKMIVFKADVPCILEHTP